MFNALALRPPSWPPRAPPAPSVVSASSAIAMPLSSAPTAALCATVVASVIAPSWLATRTREDYRVCEACASDGHVVAPVWRDDD